MSEPLSEERLAEIRARCTGASDSPWQAQEGGAGPQIVTDSCTFVGEVNIGVWTCDDPEDGCWELGRQWLADASFAAHARDDVPALLAEVERLRAEVAAMRPIVTDIAEGFTGYYRTDSNEYYRCCLCEEATFVPGGWKYDVTWRAENMKHTDNCPVTLARQIIAATSQPDPKQPS